MRRFGTPQAISKRRPKTRHCTSVRRTRTARVAPMRRTFSSHVGTLRLARTQYFTPPRRDQSGPIEPTPRDVSAQATSMRHTTPNPATATSKRQSPATRTIPMRRAFSCHPDSPRRADTRRVKSTRCGSSRHCDVSHCFESRHCDKPARSGSMRQIGARQVSPVRRTASTQPNATAQHHAPHANATWHVGTVRCDEPCQADSRHCDIPFRHMPVRLDATLRSPSKHASPMRRTRSLRISPSP